MKKFFQSNGALALLVAGLLAALTLVVSLLLSGADPVANFIGIVSTPFRAASTAVADWAEGAAEYRDKVEDLEEEVERLRQELARMEEKAREGEKASVENENLRSLLNLRSKRRDLSDLESATVTARGQSNWESSFTISKGSLHGVEAGQCVMDAYGDLVGLVKEVGLNWSTVITLVDTDIDMGGMLSRTEDAAILEGDFSLMAQGRLKLSYLPDDAKVFVGDEVVTSGRGGVYPSGLVVGHVEQVLTDPSGMTDYAVIRPKADLEGLKQVFVIKSFDIVE